MRFLIRQEDGYASKFICDQADGKPRLSRNPYPLTEERVRGLMKSINVGQPAAFRDNRGVLQMTLPQNLYIVSELSLALKRTHVGFRIFHCFMDLNEPSMSVLEHWVYFVKTFPGGKILIKHEKGGRL